MRLAAVLDDGEAVTRGDALDRRHVGRLAVEMHRHDRARARTHTLRNPIGIDRAALRVDVREHGSRAGHHDRERAVCRRERRRDHFVAGADTESAQDESDGVGSVTDADRMGRAGSGGEFLLEADDFGSEDEPSALDHAVDRAPHVGGVLAGHQRHERNPVRAHVRDGSWSPPT